METAKSTAASSSPFLDRLPPEIRNTIYRLVLVEPNGPLIITKHDFSARKTLIDTCKQIRGEAKDIILAENTFGVVCGKGEGYIAARWLASLGDRARLIKGLSIAFELSEETKKKHQSVVSHLCAAENRGVDTSSTEFKIQKSRLQDSIFLTFFPESFALAKAAHASATLGQLQDGVVRVEKREFHSGSSVGEVILRAMSRICDVVIVKRDSRQLRRYEELLRNMRQNADPDLWAWD